MRLPFKPHSIPKPQPPNPPAYVYPAKPSTKREEKMLERRESLLNKEPHKEVIAHMMQFGVPGAFEVKLAKQRKAKRAAALAATT